jgi:uncharacterized membrane protein YqhA
LGPEPDGQKRDALPVSDTANVVRCRTSLRAVARLVGNLRYLVIVAVVGIAVQAIATYGWAVWVTVDFGQELLTSSAWQQDDTIVELLQVLDLYLIGTVLIITAIGLYELFIGEVQLPSWLVIRTLSDLKSKIVEVIVLVIGIKFVEKLVTAKEPIDVLWYGLGSAAVMAVLIGWNSLKSVK